MTDQRLRELERLAAQGDEHAEVQLLRARNRAGIVSEKQLRAFALLGEPVCREVLGGAWPHPVTDPRELLGLLRPAANRGLVVRAVCSGIEPLVERWEAKGGDARMRSELTAVRDAWTAIEAGHDISETLSRGREWAHEQNFVVQGFPALALVRAIDTALESLQQTGGRFLTYAETALHFVVGFVPPDQVCRAMLAEAKRTLLT